MPRLNKPHNNRAISLFGAGESRRNVKDVNFSLYGVPDLKSNAAGVLGGSHIHQEHFVFFKVRSQRFYTH